MAKQYKLTVEKRESGARKDLKYLREDLKIPGVYYSYEGNNILFQISQHEINNAIQSGANIFTVNVGGKDQNVIFKSVQYHPVTEQIIHIDLYGVDMDTKVIVKVPIIIVGQSIGIKEEGGVLNQSMTEVEIECLPSDIPQNIEVDISDLAIGDTLRLENIEIADTFSLVADTDMLIASVVAPAKQEEVVVELEGEGEDEGEDTESTDKDEPSSDTETEENNEGESK